MSRTGGADLNGFVVLWSELTSRFFGPVKHVTFWAYLMVGVIFLGALAVWLEILLYFVQRAPESASHLRVALIAFFPALIGSVSVQLIFEEAARNKRMLAFGVMVGFVSFLLGLVLLVIKSIANDVAIPLASIASVGAVLVWWVANGLNPVFRDLDLDAAVGGPPSQPPAGDLTGYNT